MRDIVNRYVTLVVAATLAGLIGGAAIRFAVDGRGVAGPLLSLAERPFAALVAIVIAIALMTAIAVATARIVNSAVGLFVLGWGIGVMAMRSGTVVELAFLTAGREAITTPALRVGLETLLWSVLIGAASAVIWRVGGPLRDLPRPDDEHNGIVSALRGPHALRGAAAALAAIPIVWLLTRTPMVGQTIGVTVVAGMAVGILGRMWAPRVQPVFLAPLAVAAIGATQIAMALRFQGTLDAAVIVGSLPQPLVAMPIGVAGGITAGVALGIGWARSFATLAPDEDESPAPSTAKPLRSARTS